MGEYLDPWDAVDMAVNDHSAEFEVVLRGKITGAEIVAGTVTEIRIADQEIKFCDGPVFNGWGDPATLLSRNVKIRKIDGQGS